MNTRQLFLTAMVKLKRDSVNFQTASVEEKLFLYLTDNTKIGFNTDTLTWTISSPNLNSDDWNPALNEEFFSLLQTLTKEDIEKSVAVMDEKVRSVYSTLTAESLEHKFLFIMNLMKCAENNIFPTPTIRVGGGVLGNSEVSIWFDFEVQEFVFSKDEENWDVITSMEFIKDLLKRNNFFKVFTAMNNAYIQLKRKSL